MTERQARHVVPLDLLRGLAALSVAVSHYFTVNAEGQGFFATTSILGVEIFFVLSGFVLGPQIMFCVESGRLEHLRTFLVRRWMRTIPPYFVALFIVSYLTGQIGTGDFFRYALYVQNLFRQHNVIDSYPVAWSLSVEEWFYVVFPLAAIVATTLMCRTDKRIVVYTTLAFILVIALLRTTHGVSGNWDADIRRVVIFRVDAIGYGFLLYLLTTSATARNIPALRMLLDNSGFAALPMIALGVAAFIATPITEGSGQAARWLFPFVAPAFGVSGLLFFYSLRTREFGGRISGFFGFLARTSYSIYLFHLIAIMTVKPAIAAYPVALQLAIYLALLFALSALFYRYFEAPILDARPAYKRHEMPLHKGAS